MTAVDVLFRYGTPPGERELRSLDRLWEVYGIRRISFNEAEKIIRIEYDATRLNEATIESLLRRGGINVLGKVSLIAPEQPDPAKTQPA